MEVLFATTNPAKIEKYKKILEKNGIELITINDLNKKIKIEETGKDALQNAYIKAKTCYDLTKITTIGMDNTLYIEGVSEEDQPGTHVRRIGGKELNDEEMINYYTSLVKKYGGKLIAKWRYGLVIYDNETVKKYIWDRSDFFLVSKPCKIRNDGYPLDSISIDPSCNKYFVEMTSKDKKKSNNIINEDKSIEFLLNSLKNKKS